MKITNWKSVEDQFILYFSVLVLNGQINKYIKKNGKGKKRYESKVFSFMHYRYGV